MWKRPRRLSYADVASTLALVVALGGTSAYAADRIRSGDIVDGQVKRVDLGAGAVTSRKVLDGSLLAKDFKASALETLRGPKGDQGDPGAPGATSVVVRTGTAQVPAGSSGGAVAACLPGERATGGGVNLLLIENGDAVLRSYPTTGGSSAATAGQTPTAWFARVFNAGDVERPVTVFAVCAAP